MKADLIKSQLRGKVIGVIGSTSPTSPYRGHMGFLVGYMLQEMLGDKNTLLTGGVEGVGVDVFCGYAAHKSSGNFVALIPHTVEYPVMDEFNGHIFDTKPQYTSVPYALPDEYMVIAQTTNTLIKEVRGGKDMSERRELLSGICDILIMVNGGYGTLDEAVMAVDDHNKPVIVINGSGGSSHILLDIRDGINPYRAAQILTSKRSKGKQVYNHPLPDVKNKHNIYATRMPNFVKTVEKFL